MYKIEKNVPIRFSGKSLFPFEKMEVGDSFAIPFKDYEDLRAKQNKVCISIKRFVKNNTNGWKFCSKKDSTKNEIRVWRTL